MGVISQLADEMEQCSRELIDSPPSPTVIRRMQTLLGVSAFMLRKQQEDYEKLNAVLMEPPRIINAMPPGTTFMP
jgi:hypothetical protein